MFQVARPISMKKDGIQTRKRKPKGVGKSKSKARQEVSLGKDGSLFGAAALIKDICAL